MNIFAGIGCFVLSYLIGSISFSRIVSRLLKKDSEIQPIEIPIEGTDRTYKMSAVGATTVGIVHGPKVGCTIGLLDMLKVAIPTLAARLLYPQEYHFLLAAVGGMAGHNWPIYHRFKGGRGISALYGGLFAVDWLGALVTSGLGMFIGMVLLKDFAIAYFAGLWLLVPWVIIRFWDWHYLVYAIVVNILFMLAMMPDIKQILEIRREQGSKGDLTSMMDMTPMGKMMRKLAERIGLMKT